MSRIFDNDDELFDDMMMLDMLEDEEMDDFLYSEKPTGSCLLFILAIGAVGAIPIVSIINLLA